jgi:hypothetical protein
LQQARRVTIFGLFQLKSCLAAFRPIQRLKPSPGRSQDAPKTRLHVWEREERHNKDLVWRARRRRAGTILAILRVQQGHFVAK